MFNPNQIKFTCTSFAGTNKVGLLRPDGNGYYTMCVGALNVFNSANQYYQYEGCKQLFEASSQLQRRIKRGVLRGEYGHPKWMPGWTEDEYANRLLSIWESESCCHHKEIWLDFELLKDQGSIAIMSKVCPSGAKGDVLRKQLDNKDENVCFSIRSFTDDYRERGQYNRIIRTIVTWDYVNEPGIAHAEKYKSPAIETLSEHTFSKDAIKRAVTNPITGRANESVVLSADELFTSFGWVDKPSGIIGRW